jgi:hypothetical protein
LSAIALPHQSAILALIAARAQIRLFRPFTDDLTETPFIRFFSFMFTFFRSQFFNLSPDAANTVEVAVVDDSPAD